MQTIQNMDQFYACAKKDTIQIFVFTTKWCGDCMFIKPFFPEIEQKFSDLTFYEVDRDQFMDVARDLGIMGIPSFVAYRNGVEISRFVSSLRKTKQEIIDYIEQTIQKG